MQNLLTSPYLPIIYIAAIAAIYVLLFAIPNRKRQKKAEEILNTLKSGHRILTIGGIFAEVDSIDGEFIRVKLSEDNNHMTIHRSAIQRITNNSDSENP